MHCLKKNHEILKTAVTKWWQFSILKANESMRFIIEVGTEGGVVSLFNLLILVFHLIIGYRGLNVYKFICLIRPARRITHKQVLRIFLVKMFCSSEKVKN